MNLVEKGMVLSSELKSCRRGGIFDAIGDIKLNQKVSVLLRKALWHFLNRNAGSCFYVVFT
jgi:hypothetical protein